MIPNPAKYVLILVLVAPCAASAAADYFQQDVHYTMRVRLDVERKMLAGDETILYTNNSPDTLREFYLHLYPNAYRNRHTAFMRAYRRKYNLNLVDVSKKKRGWLEVRNVRIDGRNVVVEVDDTIARMALPQPLAPGASMSVELEFESKIRERMGRAGYRGDHYDFAQWYPKVVVYDENGFHPDKFTAPGEFYGEFGTFDVHLEIPGGFVVAATGEVRDGDPGWGFNRLSSRAHDRRNEGTRSVHFHAENVHDFAWCADPTFVVEDTTVAGVEVRSVYRRENADQWADTTLSHAVRALEWLVERVGPYPYPQLNVIDALLGGGMEYPMLVMDGRAHEGLAVHEIGHIYFYGILANDERAEAWLDEGFTSFQSTWFKEHRYGPWGNRNEWNWYQRMTPQRKLWEDYRNEVFDLQRRGYGERVAQSADKFEHSYHEHVYDKAALTLASLRYVLGEEDFGRMLRGYYDRWKLKHVNEIRFQRAVEDVTGRDLTLAFEQWLHTTKVCDYRLASVKTQEVGGRSLTRVHIEREGELFIPIELHFEMEDGSVEKRRLDGRLRSITETFELPGKPKRTSVNPDNEIMDIDLADNISPRRVRWQIDWPNNDYFAEDGYTIRHRPGVWYNLEDGVKSGWHFRGSYYNWSRRFNLGVYYGALSERVDFSTSFVRPIRFLGRRGDLGVSGYKMEGRRRASAWVTLRQRSRLSVPPTHVFTVGYDYHKLTNPRYLASTETYDTNRADVGFDFSYGVSPQVDLFSVGLATGLRLGRKFTGGKYRYERFDLDLRIKARREFVPFDLRLRGFVGLIGGDMPTQRKFSLSGGGPLQREQRFWLRSRGAVWRDLNYHEPGDGNLRGYVEGGFGVNRILAFNAEFGGGLPLLGRLLSPVLGKVSWYGFYDVGRTLDDENPIGSSARIQALVDAGVLDATLQDAGIGLRSRPGWPFWDLWLRVDMPLWVSHPLVNGETDETKFRYLFSISAAF